VEQTFKVEIQGEYAPASTLAPIVVNLLAKFGENELEVNPADALKIDLLWFNPKKALPNWVAKTIKTPSYYVALGMKPLVIVCLLPAFNEYSPDVIKAVLFHELKHITFDDAGYYKLRDHDIKDFKFLVEKIGLNYEKASEMFSGV
jgi:hypothetical protein